MEWYRRGRPRVHEFHPFIKPNKYNQIPSTSVLAKWMKRWHTRAKQIDEEVFVQLKRRLAAEKVQILERHAEQAREMQNIAIEWLREHRNELTPASAVRLYVAAHDLEMRAIGFKGQAGDAEKTDEELLEELKALIADSPAEFEQLLEADAEAA